MDLSFDTYQERFRKGEWRGTIFRDAVLADIQRFANPTVLDIGCGRGFDDNLEDQYVLSQASGRYIGVEPDTNVELSPLFAETHRCLFEEAFIEPNSVDIAFCVMVLEHLDDPRIFWDKAHSVLRPGGIFWGFSMDAQYYFPYISLIFEKLRLKDLYLTLLHGQRGENRYENYPVFYRSNSPQTVKQCSEKFKSVTYLNFNRIGQMDFYYPRPLRWLGRGIDSALLALNMPGSVFAVRAVK